MSDKPTFKDPQTAFIQAINEDRLSLDPEDYNYAGNYMYMGTWGQKDSFKHKTTRKYLN